MKAGGKAGGHPIPLPSSTLSKKKRDAKAKAPPPPLNRATKKLEVVETPRGVMAKTFSADTTVTFADPSVRASEKAAGGRRGDGRARRDGVEALTPEDYVVPSTSSESMFGPTIDKEKLYKPTDASAKSASSSYTSSGLSGSSSVDDSPAAVFDSLKRTLSQQHDSLKRTLSQQLLSVPKPSVNFIEDDVLSNSYVKPHNSSKNIKGILKAPSTTSRTFSGKKPTPLTSSARALGVDMGKVSSPTPSTSKVPILQSLQQTWRAVAETDLVRSLSRAEEREGSDEASFGTSFGSSESGYIHIEDSGSSVSDLTDVRSHYTDLEPQPLKKEELYDDLGAVEEGRGDWKSDTDGEGHSDTDGEGQSRTWT